MKKNSDGCNQVIGRAMYLERIGCDFVKSALLLFDTKEKTREHSDYIYSFNLLASLALEILPKSITATRICLVENHKSSKKICNIINKKLVCLGHKLDDIFEAEQGLKKALNISNIERLNTGAVDEFHFTVSSEKIVIKNLEGARYGAFARNENFGAGCYDKNTISFLENLLKETTKIRSDMVKKFDDSKA